MLNACITLLCFHYCFVWWSFGVVWESAEMLRRTWCYINNAVTLHSHTIIIIKKRALVFSFSFIPLFDLVYYLKLFHVRAVFLFASIFKKSYFTGMFLPVLLQPRPVSQFKYNNNNWGVVVQW